MTGRKWPEFNCGGKLWQVSEFSRIDRSSLLRGGKGGRGGGRETGWWCRDVVCNYSIAVIKLQILRGYEREHSFSPGPIQPHGKPSGGPRRVLHASMTPLTNSDIVKRRRNPFIFRLLLYSLSTDIAVKRHGPRRLLRFCLSVAEEEEEEEEALSSSETITHG